MKPLGNDLLGKKALASQRISPFLFCFLLFCLSKVLGGTKGIGLAIAKHLSSRGAHVTIVGRDVGSSLAELDQVAGQDKHGFVRADLSLMSSAKSVVREYLATTGDKMDFLILTAGIGKKERGVRISELNVSFALATMQGYTPTAENVDLKMSLHCYSRLAAALEARDALEKSGGACLFVLSAGIHSVPASLTGLDAANFSLKQAADAAGFYTDCIVASLAETTKNVRWVHAAPGFVASSWGTELNPVLRLVVRGMQVFGRSPSVCADKMMKALIAPERGCILADQEGQTIKPMPEMTEEIRRKVFDHCMETVTMKKA